MNAIVDQLQKTLILAAPQATKNGKAILGDLLFQDSSFHHSQHSPESLCQSQSQDIALWPQSKSIPWYIGFVLLLCLLLHGPASWLSSSESQNRVWKKIEITAKPAQNLALQATELQQTKVNLGYDVASGSSVYCNGDPVNGLDPDGRCVEGTSAGWANGNGSFAGTYDSSQANSKLAYGLGWTFGGALGDVNAAVARPVAYAAALSLYGLNTAVESTENFLGGPGAGGAIRFIAPLMALEPVRKFVFWSKPETNKT